MQFRSIRFIDQVLGRVLLLAAAPLCWLLGLFLPRRPTSRKRIFFIKLHGGGSLMIALPSLLGMRRAFPDALFTLICTPETQAYAALTGVFDAYAIIDSHSFPSLIMSGLRALRQSFRNDLCIDLEPHSFLAAVFTMATLGVRRLGFVKAGDHYRAVAYTDALFFNPHAPIYLFYDQLAGILNAQPVAIDECRQALKAGINGSQPLIDASRLRPAVYVNAFASGLSSERMMSAQAWIDQLSHKFGAAPFTLLLGGGTRDVERGRAMEAQLRQGLPHATVINACGTRTLAQAASDMASVDEFWSIDSGPLHIARLIGKRCRSYWGPTNPAFLLRGIPGLEESVQYLGFPCSPCVHVTLTPPCGGNNQCMRHFSAPPALPPPVFIKSSR